MPDDAKLPHAEAAYVERAKIVSCLLNPAHRDGRGKSDFFRHVGFTDSRWLELAAGLRKIAQANRVKQAVTTEFGINYVDEGELETPVGRRVWVRTVWEITPERPAPRLITAYPRKAEHD